MQPKESNSKYHFMVSMLKSGLRMVGFIALLFESFETAAVLLMTAEIAGIAEEL